MTKHNFHTAACSGCFLATSAPETKNTANAEGNRSTKNDIRPLSQPLSTAAAAVPGELLTDQSHTYTRTQQTQTQSGIFSQATFDNVDALHEASIQLAVLAGQPSTLLHSTGFQVAPGAADAVATHSDETTTPAPVVVNAHAVALSHAIAKVHGMRVTSRPHTSASAPQPQHLLPESFLSSAVEQVQKLPKVPPGSTVPKDLNSFAFGQQPSKSQQQLLVSAERKAQGVNQNVLTSMQHLVLPIKHATEGLLTRITPAAKDSNSFASAQLQAKRQQLPLSSSKVAVQHPLVLPVIVEQLPKITPAATGPKDINSFAFGTLPTSSQQLSSALAKPDLVKAELSNLPQLTRPGFGNHQSKDNALTSTPSRDNRIPSAAAPHQFSKPISDSLLYTQKTTTPAQITHTVVHTQPLSKPINQFAFN